jgi:hypothetical protein
VSAPRVDVRTTYTPTRAGLVASFEVICTLTEGELGTGDAVRVELPRSWHVGPRNAAKRVQATDPGGPNFVHARTTARSGLRCEIEGESADEYVKSRR